MDFLKILRSFEEFIFEATTWLIFYPLTLWRAVRRPLAAMAYSDREQEAASDARYDDALSPPMLLLFTIVLGNVLAAAAHLPPAADSSEFTKALASSQQNLVVFRSLVFSLVPIVSAAVLLKRQGTPLTRDALRPPFYAQCYLAAPWAAAVSIGGVFLQRADLPSAVGLVTIAGAATWFLAVQTRWYRLKLKVSWVNASLTALSATAASVIGLLVVLVPLALI